MCRCVGFPKLGRPKAAATHWLSFSNTRQESEKLFLSVPPHQGDEWVLLISWVHGWHLPFPFATSTPQLSFSVIPWKAERKCQKGWVNGGLGSVTAAGVWVSRFWHVTWWKYNCPCDPCGGSVLFDELDKNLESFLSQTQIKDGL